MLIPLCGGVSLMMSYSKRIIEDGSGCESELEL